MDELTWLDELRAAITASGKSQYALAKETNVPQSTISKYLAGAALHVGHYEALAKAVGGSLKFKQLKKTRE